MRNADLKEGEEESEIRDLKSKIDLPPGKYIEKPFVMPDFPTAVRNVLDQEIDD